MKIPASLSLFTASKRAEEGHTPGSNLEANGLTALAFGNTMVASAAAGLSWMCTEWVIKKKPSLLGVVSGAVAGLVAITPACGWVGIGGALAIGLLAGVVCLWGVLGLKKLLGADDSLDVFGIHGVGGIQTKGGLGGLGAVTEAVPGFPFRVFVAAI